MREIKFRVWIKLYKHDSNVPISQRTDFGFPKMVIPMCVYSENGFEYREGLSIRQISKSHYDFELMQFTGLQDTCGVPIYEGDIVREKSSNKLLQIVWIKHLAMFLCKPIEAPEEWEPMNYDECISDLSFGNCIPNEYLTVVGNVFENQELLQEGI